MERQKWNRLEAAKHATLHDRAGLMACDSGTVLSHASAARALGLATYGAEDGLIHVTRRRYHDRILTRIVAGIKHHAGKLSDSDIVEIDGMPATNAVRTALDVASEFGYHAGLVTTDAVLRSGVPKAVLQAAVDEHPCHPHVATRRAVVADADGRAETPLETLGRVLVKAMGISDVVLQETFELQGGPNAIVDLYSPGLQHVFECDGKVKYRGQVNWQGEPLTAQDIVWQEKLRDDRLRGRGLGVSRLFWRDIHPDAFDRASARLWREIHSQNAAGLFASRPHGHSA